MSIEDLRAKALAHNENVTWTYTVCLDADLRGRLNKATEEMLQLRKEATTPAAENKDAPDKPKRKNLADKDIPLDAKISAAEETVQRIEDSIPDDELLVLKFGRLTPDRYQQLQTDNMASHDGKLDLWEMRTALAAEGFRAAEDRHGADTGMSWDEICTSVLDSLDAEYIHMGLVNLNRSGAFIPFGLANSGPAATS